MWWIFLLSIFLFLVGLLRLSSLFNSEMFEGCTMFRAIKKLCILAALVSMASSVLAASDLKIAVVNSQMALLESEPAKGYAEKSEARFSKQIKHLKRLEGDFKKLAEKFDKEALTLAESERAKIQIEMRRKKEDWELQARQLQADRNELDQKEFEKIQPLLVKAIEQVARVEGYDMVLEKASARFVKPEFDLTRKVIDRINRLAAGRT